jgi:SAM-dependent methyltransferase
MTVKKHYDQHLGSVYSWMCGDFNERASEFRKFLTGNSVYPIANRTTIDLGAGHGIQSVPLAELGFNVIAIDFNEELLNELRSNSHELNIAAFNEDIINFEKYADKPELIICCGDTISHLNSMEDIKQLISKIAEVLCENGKLILSFRDQSLELKGPVRFIPVKSDENKILTCMLEYETDFVRVTDLLYERIDREWQQKVSSYRKVRVQADHIVNIIEACNLSITFNQNVDRLTTIIAVK